MSDALAARRARHQPHLTMLAIGDGPKPTLVTGCSACRTPWPCDYEQERQARQAAEAEARRLREDLERALKVMTHAGDALAASQDEVARLRAALERIGRMIDHQPVISPQCQWALDRLATIAHLAERVLDHENGCPVGNPMGPSAVACTCGAARQALAGEQDGA